MPICNRIMLPVVGSLLLAVGCVGAQREQPLARPQPVESLTHENLNAVLWMQTAVEYRAATTQAYALAHVRLDQALADLSGWTDAVRGTSCGDREKTAVIVDVDETIFDNSPTQARAVAMNLHRFDSEYWTRWESAAVADAIPGAAEFLRYADSKGVTVFYITNRKDEAGLRRNLDERGFPVSAATDTLLMAGEYLSGNSPNDKQGRRDFVASRYAVLLSVGDDLGDFVALAGVDKQGRRAVFERNQDRWGRQWIVIPNPAYGSWELVLDAPQDPDDVRLKKKHEALRLPTNSAAPAHP